MVNPNREVLPLRLKKPVQPLVFCFSEVSPLCGAAAALYELSPNVGARLCLYNRKYYLAVNSTLKMRAPTCRTVGKYGRFLGPCRVLYSFYEEHGKIISKNAVQELGGALQ